MFILFIASMLHINCVLQDGASLTKCIVNLHKSSADNTVNSYKKINKTYSFYSDLTIIPEKKSIISKPRSSIIFRGYSENWLATSVNRPTC